MLTDKPKAAARYQVDDLLVDVGRAQVTRAGTEVALPKLSFDLLLALIDAAPSIATADDLIARVWPGLVISPETISQRVKLLREALGDDPRQPRYLTVVRGRGYRLVADVARLDNLPTSAATVIVGGSGGPASANTAYRSRWRWMAAVFVTTLLAIVAIGYRRESLEPPPVDTAAPPGSVAVLPFANLTGDASKDYLGDGMAEELINTLAKVTGLKVPARTSSFAYKGRNIDIRQIAKDLGVGTILEGSVRQAGKHIRVTAQLISAQDGSHIWSETYDEEFTDLFKLQDKLATRIARALKPNLGGAVPAGAAQPPPTQDVEAYQLYLQGWSLANRASVQNETRAIEYFQRAVIRDPKFGRAYAGIAEAHMNLGAGLGQKPFENYAAAEHAAQAALALDPSLANAHNSLAGVNAFRGQLLEMEAHDRAAQSLSPNDGFIRVIRAEHEGVLGGHLRQMLDDGQKAYALAPAHPYVVALTASYYSLLGRDAEALKYAGFALDLGHPKDSEPLPTIQARAARRAGRYAQAAEILAGTFDGSDPAQARTAEVIRRVYGALADPAQRAAAISARARLYPKLNTVGLGGATTTDASPCIASSLSYVLLGALDVAYDLGNQCLSNLAPAAVRISDQTADLWSPEMRPFRQDPRFQAFATRLGFMEYWQQYGPPDDCDLKDGRLTCH